MKLEKILKVTQAQYTTLADGGTVGTESGLQDGKIYLIETDPMGTDADWAYFAKPQCISSYGNNVAVISNGTTRKVSFRCSAEIDYEAAVARVKLSIWSANTSALDNTTRFMKQASLFEFIGMNPEDWEIDTSRISGNVSGCILLGNWYRNDTIGYDPFWSWLFQFYGPFTYFYPSSDYIYFTRVNDAADATSMDGYECGMQDLCMGNGISTDIVFPFKSKAS